MLMLDLCAGLGGASQVMRARGWDVVTLDYDPAFGCDITADLRTWSWQGPRPRLVWGSPPCDEFAREFMPWSKTGATPSLDLVMAVRRVVEETQPDFWVLENVKGAARWLRPILGEPRQIVGPFYLWGNFPPLGVDMRRFRKKESYSSSQPAERAKVPYELSLAVAVACEQQRGLWAA
jgi:hypothetical protein